MKLVHRALRIAFVLGLVAGALGACGNRQRGPLEQAGHEIDDTAEDVEEAVDEASE
jgi:hypothetical protein